MKDEKYPIEYSSDFLEYDFKSVKAGTPDVPMKITFDKYDTSGLSQAMLVFDPIYNLALTALDPQTNQYSDTIVLNRGDFKLIMTTVAQTVYMFRDAQPMATIFFEGSTPQRTNIYGRLIVGRLSELATDFIVLGITNGQLKAFMKGEVYEAYLLCPKK